MHPYLETRLRIGCRGACFIGGSFLGLVLRLVYFCLWAILQFCKELSRVYKYYNFVSK